MLKSNKKPTDLTIIGNLLHKPKDWQPNIKLFPWMSKTNKELITNFYLSKILKLLTTRNETLSQEIEDIFQAKEVDLKDITELLNKKTVVRELKTHRMTEKKPKVIETSLPERKLYTFSLKKDKKSNQWHYYLYDGKKKHRLLGAKACFDYLLERIEKEKNIILMGWGILKIEILHPLLQESLTRGFFPTIKGGLKKRGRGTKIVGCYLKGNSIIIKDVENFYLEKSKENQKLDSLYKTLQKVAKKTKNKYQVSLFDKNISTLIRIAWIDFWNEFEQNQKIYGWERIWSFNKTEDEFIRKSYQGGYLDLFNEQKYQGIVSDWDFQEVLRLDYGKKTLPYLSPLVN